MKILQLISSYAPMWSSGGPVRVFYSYARQLSNMGHGVTVLTANTKQIFSQLNQPIVYNDIDFFYYKKFDNYILAKYYLNYSFNDIFSWSRSHLMNFDIAHFGEIRFPGNIVLCHQLRAFRKPYVISAFGMLPRRRSAVKTLYDQLFIKPMIQNASALLAQTQHEEAKPNNPNSK